MNLLHGSRRYNRKDRKSSFSNKTYTGFTLIELLVVVGIIAILMVTVVIVMNPGQLLAQSRDSNRLSDIASMDTSLRLASIDSLSYGSTNTVYVSIPDNTATSTAGDQCQGLGLPSLPATYSYHCAASSTYRLTNGTGWIPVNMTQISQGTPLSQLPIDPVNTSSSRNYYTYTTNGQQFEVTMSPESQKYRTGGGADVISNDGGSLASVYEKGTKLGLEPLDYGDTSLVGYWTFDEGTSSIAYDYSGNGNNSGSFTGTPVWQTSACKSQGCINFPSGGNYVSIPAASSINITNNLTISTWIKGNTLVAGGASIHPINKWTGTGDANYVLYYCGSACGSNNAFAWYANIGGTWHLMNGYTTSISTGTWNYITIVYTNNAAQMYWNGSPGIPTSFSGLLATSSANLVIGNDSTGQDISMDNTRIYNRALSTSEIQAMYNGSK